MTCTYLVAFALVVFWGTLWLLHDSVQTSAPHSVAHSVWQVQPDPAPPTSARMLYLRKNLRRLNQSITSVHGDLDFILLNNKNTLSQIRKNTADTAYAKSDSAIIADSDFNEMHRRGMRAPALITTEKEFFSFSDRHNSAVTR